MVHFTFVIPENKEDLLRSSINDEYTVKNVSLRRDIPNELKVHRQSLRDEGAEFILDSFDTYFSVLHHGDTLSIDLIYRSFEDLHKGSIELNKTLGFILEDKDSISDEIRLKYLNIIKMLIYLYTQTILKIEKYNADKRERQISIPKGRKKLIIEEEFEVDKNGVLLLLNNIIQREISLFWESQIIEESFVNLISGIAYEFLQNPSIKKQTEEFIGIFNLLGYLLKAYNHGTTFVIRITQLIKLNEHLVQCIPKGIHHLVQSFNYKSLLHEMIEELTEWQTDEKHQDAQGARNCASVLSSLAALMPELMMPEVVSLNNYLYHESANLRISVIMVMVEVILNNLTSHDLDEEQKSFRDELFDMIMEHTEDNSVIVRARVFQQWARMQKEMAIPLKFQLLVLEKVVEHLFDKGALARKFAINCLTTFLSCNTFGANLSLSSLKEELEKNKEELKAMKEKFKDPKVEQLMALQKQWDGMVENLKKELERELTKGKENEDVDDESIPLDQAQEIIRMYLSDFKFKEAINVCKVAVKDNKFVEKFKEKSSIPDEDFYMGVFYAIFFDVSKIIGQLENYEFVSVTEKDYRDMENASSKIDVLEQCIKYLEEIDKAIDMCVELLETTSITDMQESIEFFVAVYQFNIDRASDGILAMLRVMQRTEQERKDAIIVAFKRIYLVSDSQNLNDHCSVVVQRLIRLVKTLPAINLTDLQEIISDWISKGTLDNSVIEMLWQIVTQRISSSIEDEIVSVVLLRMAALGRKSIISRNINLITGIAFGERGRDNMQLLAVCCHFLSVAYEKVDVNSPNCPFKIKPDENCFKLLEEILEDLFFKDKEFYHEALYSGLDFVYKLSSKPEAIADQLIQSIVSKLTKKIQENSDSEFPQYALIRLCQLCGFLSIKQLEYMDDTVYKELKRRQNVREEQNNKTKTKKNKKKNKRKSMTATAAFEASNLNVSMGDNENVMEGAQAEDADADYILNTLEKCIVTGTGMLAQMSSLIIYICERPNIYKLEELQFASVTALSRYMLVSGDFCKQNVRLLFTIFEKTTYPSIKENILIHLADMFARFPNVVEPWTDRLFISITHQLPEVRRSSFYILSKLILGDMIRAHSHIPKMASCLANEDEKLRSMSKTFFLKLSHKENNLYNALPDIFSHFIETNVDDDGIKNTMRLLFDMVENAKHLENVIARFCTKFQHTEENRQHRLISYCLTLIKYNDKALKRIMEDFPSYKHLVHDEEVYANFRTIIQNCNKQQVGKTDLKPMAAELECLIKSVFELQEDVTEPSQPVPKSVKKRTKSTRTAKGKKKKLRISDAGDDSD